MRLVVIIILIFTCTTQAQEISDNESKRMWARQAVIDRFAYDAPICIIGVSLEAFQNLGDIKKRNN